MFLAAPPPFGFLGLVPGAFLDLMTLVPSAALYRPWTVLTYQFVHAGFLHLLFNMMGLFFLGPRLEERIGGRHFLALYLMSGTFGALLSVLTPDVAIVGASGAVFGVFMGFARYWPRERILIWGVLPVEARILVIFLAAASIWGGFSGGGDVAHFAHLGGFAGGWTYLRLLEWNSPARKFRRQAEAVAPSRTGVRDLKRWEEVNREGLHPLNREEYERVLEKARVMGAPSLTFQERAFLERFTED
ncbi:MAG: rhomboid family intramembrane serine protease [Gemmatimonadetes bacterium]|nr:rhomboid family intramembrane serine protease [Gemmatimonadota bacterium]